MPPQRTPKNQGPRDLSILVIARADTTHVHVAAVDTSTNTWVRAVDAAGGLSLPTDFLTLSDGTYLQTLDTIRARHVAPMPRVPVVEAGLLDPDAALAWTGHIEERSLSRTFAELAVPHLDTLLPAGKRVMTVKDFLPGGRQRSIATIRPDQLQHVQFSYEGEDARVGVSFRHRGQAYGGPGGLPCPDILLRAYAREALRKAGSLTITLDAKACVSRFASARFYLTIGLVEGEGGTFWPQVLGFHPIRAYRAPIDYERL